MRSVSALAVCFMLLSATASAAYLTIEPETQKEMRQRKGGVVFPVRNQTIRPINRIFGWVYGYDDARPSRLRLVANPHKPAIRISPGSHAPGKTALYWFEVPAYYLKMRNFGVVVYDASITFDN